MSFTTYLKRHKILESGRKFRYSKKLRGLCMRCQNKISEGSNTYCDTHLIEHRNDSRDVYRIKHGIPLDAPVITRGKRNPVTDWSQMDWEKSNIQIARELGISREAVRQQRNKININSKQTP